MTTASSTTPRATAEQLLEVLTPDERADLETRAVSWTASATSTAATCRRPP